MLESTDPVGHLGGQEYWTNGVMKPTGFCVGCVAYPWQERTRRTERIKRGPLSSGPIRNRIDISKMRRAAFALNLSSRRVVRLGRRPVNVLPVTVLRIEVERLLVYPAEAVVVEVRPVVLFPHKVLARLTVAFEMNSGGQPIAHGAEAPQTPSGSQAHRIQPAHIKLLVPREAGRLIRRIGYQAVSFKLRQEFFAPAQKDRDTALVEIRLQTAPRLSGCDLLCSAGRSPLSDSKLDLLHG